MHNGVTILFKTDLKPENFKQFLLSLKDLIFSDEKVKRPKDRFDRRKMDLVEFSGNQEAYCTKQVMLVLDFIGKAYVFDDIGDGQVQSLGLDFEPLILPTEPFNRFLKKGYFRLFFLLLGFIFHFRILTNSLLLFFDHLFFFIIIGRGFFLKG